MQVELELWTDLLYECWRDDTPKIFLGDRKCAFNTNMFSKSREIHQPLHPLAATNPIFTIVMRGDFAKLSVGPRVPNGVTPTRKHVVWS